MLASSWRINVTHDQRWRDVSRAGRPCVFLLWHETLLPLLWHHRYQGVTLLISEARDGQYLSDLGAALGYNAVRGSSTRGGARALLGAVRQLQAGRSVAFTPDGPRCSVRELKPGELAAAQRGRSLLVPVYAEADRAWRLHASHRDMISTLLARVRITYGSPFQVGTREPGLVEGLARA